MLPWAFGTLSELTTRFRFLSRICFRATRSMSFAAASTRSMNSSEITRRLANSYPEQDSMRVTWPLTELLSGPVSLISSVNLALLSDLAAAPDTANFLALEEAATAHEIKMRLPSVILSRGFLEDIVSRWDLILSTTMAEMLSCKIEVVWMVS